MLQIATLDTYLAAQAPDAWITQLVQDLADSAIAIADIIALGPLAGGAVGVAGTLNVHDEEQKELDLVANSLLLKHLDKGGTLTASASEEMEDIRVTPEGVQRGPYLLVFDPLDGSSNIDVNVSIGTIFSILRTPNADAEPSEQDFLRPGTEQVGAGYFIYGPATQLMLTLGDGVFGFTLDRDSMSFVQTHQRVTIPASTREFAINAAYQRHWHPPVARYIEQCLAGESGPRGKNFNMRWVASLVAEVHRILSRGGVFIYPADKRSGRESGHLRLLYEANPMAMLIEQAQGAASNGAQRIMELAPQALHQRTPLVLGAADEVGILAELYTA